MQCLLQLLFTGILSLQWPQHRAGVFSGTQRRGNIIPLNLELQQSHKVTFLQSLATMGNEAGFAVAQGLLPSPSFLTGPFLVGQEDEPGSKLDLHFYLFIYLHLFFKQFLGILY